MTFLNCCYCYWLRNSLLISSILLVLQCYQKYLHFVLKKKRLKMMSSQQTEEYFKHSFNKHTHTTWCWPCILLGSELLFFPPSVFPAYFFFATVGLNFQARKVASLLLFYYKFHPIEWLLKKHRPHPPRHSKNKQFETFFGTDHIRCWKTSSLMHPLYLTLLDNSSGGAAANAALKGSSSDFRGKFCGHF